MRVKQLIPDPNEAAEGSQPLVTFENLDSGVRELSATQLGARPNSSLKSSQATERAQMNWNSADYAGLLPIPLRFSGLVGDIPKEADGEPEAKYKYYM
jgi:hypothetical protein